MRFDYPEIDPIIFSFSVGNLELALRWYALSYILGILVAWKLMQNLSKYSSLWPDSLAPIQPSAVEDLMTYMILGIILGGRIGYVVFYQPGYYLYNPEDILKVWNGGMSFHGGFLGVVFGALLYGKKKKSNLLSLGDIIAIASPPGLFFGRLANFINGELWGKTTEVSWGILFPKAPDFALGIARHPSQIYAAVLEGLIPFIYIQWRFWKTDLIIKKPGQLTGEFLILYSISRILNEIFREPDATLIGGMSRGQFYSIFLIIGGILLVLLAKKRAIH